MSRTLPGDLTSPTAGPALCPQMSVRYLTNPGVVWTVHAPGFARVALETGVCSLATHSLLVPVEPALNMDALARWLSRHLGNWQSWEVSSAVSGMNWSAYAGICKQFGAPADRREPYPAAGDILTRWCLAAGAR